MIAYLISAFSFLNLLQPVLPVVPVREIKPWSSRLMATHTISLEDRQPDKWVNGVFKDNILLNLAYMDGKVKSKETLNWNEVRQPFQYSFKLLPNQTFAFHDDVLPKYAGQTMLLSPAHFNFQEGFESDGYLAGDGVCHLASLMNWVAKDAGLDVTAPSNHNFATIADIPKEYGVAIYHAPNQPVSNAQENLYITNNHSEEITLSFNYSNDSLTFSILV